VYLYPVSSPDKTKNVVTNALWDTGASLSAISLDIASQLNLKPTSRIRVAGVHSIDVVEAGLVTVELPDNVVRKDVRVAICNLNASFGMILGMNIIMLGDLAISNNDEQTLFSFAIPPFKSKIDFSLRKDEP
jgi:predicted aspartyl protease